MTRAFALIDAAYLADPGVEDGQPAALLYGQRISAEIDRMFPQAGDVLRIAARGQHFERWLFPRAGYPEGREAYLAWRREQARRHAVRLGGIMADAGYDALAQDRVGVLSRKEGTKCDADVQALEDVICLVFLRWYFRPFAGKHAPDALARNVEKTARKGVG